MRHETTETGVTTDAGPMRLAVLGLGAMGTRMAARLAHAGHTVTVWNRSDGRGTPPGCRRADSPAAAAAAGADLAIAMVRDDGASRAVWLGEDGALATLGPDAIGVECSTLSAPWVGELATAFHGAGRRLLDAPLAGSRPQAEAGQLVFLVGGAEGDLDAARPALDAMGIACHAGGQGAGTLAKLMVNAVFAAQIAGMAELIGLARRSPHNVARLIDVVSATPVVAPAIGGAAVAMLGDAFPPAFPIDLVEKDLRLLAATADAWGATVPLGDAVRGIYAAAIAEGFGEDNITGVAQRYA